MIQAALRVYRLQLYVIFSGLLLMWTITPFGKQVTGFGIGLAVSAYCLWLLARRVEKLGKSIVMKEKARIRSFKPICSCHFRSYHHV